MLVVVKSLAVLGAISFVDVCPTKSCVCYMTSKSYINVTVVQQPTLENGCIKTYRYFHHMSGLTNYFTVNNITNKFYLLPTFGPLYESNISLKCQVGRTTPFQVVNTVSRPQFGSDFIDWIDFEATN